MNKKIVVSLAISSGVIAFWVIFVLIVLPWKISQLQNGVRSSCQPACQLSVEQINYSLLSPLNVTFEKVELRGATALGDLITKIPWMEVSIAPMSLFDQMRFSDVLVKNLEVDFIERPRITGARIPMVFALAAELMVQGGSLRYRNQQSQQLKSFAIESISWGKQKTKRLGFLYANLKAPNGQEIDLRFRVLTNFMAMNNEFLTFTSKNQWIYDVRVSQRMARVELSKTQIPAMASILQIEKNKKNNLKNPFRFRISKENNESVFDLIFKTLDQIAQLH